MPDWSLEQDAAGRSVVSHHALPRFTATWTSGDAGLAGTDGPYWSDAGRGGEDSLHIFGFRWIDRAPDDTAFERLMQAAARVIDAWITGRL
jgi:hypothetical protein